MRVMHIVCMKRTNVVLDEDLLEKARRLSEGRTYTATVTKALEAVVRKEELKRALDDFQREAAKGDFYRPGYLEEIRPQGDAIQEPKRRVSGLRTVPITLSSSAPRSR